jgi:hypothetical protein
VLLMLLVLAVGSVFAFFRAWLFELAGTFTLPFPLSAF